MQAIFSAFCLSPYNGRFGSVTDGTHTFTYGYTANSNLIGSVVGPAHTVTNTPETTRNVLLTKANTRNSNNTVISNIDYTVNTIGQRTNATRSGASTNSTAWQYDALGQVTQADDTNNTADRAYQYDGIGNRKKSADSLTLPGSDNYTANALNQYTIVPQAPAAPTFDADGNMTTGPLPVSPTSTYILAWDAENRLTEVKNSSATTIQQNIYDAYSRKIATTAGGTTTLIIYDGWNRIAEYTGSTPTLTKTNLWGPDLSGSMQGAGGVSGLLSTTDHSSTPTTHFPLFDGNGNITEYINSAETVVAHYEYDPFGNTTVATGTKANDFEYRFSTKPLDPITGLYYYGYRYYDPYMGRWLSRDPIEEGGGINLYGFVGNDGVNSTDYLGKIDTITVKGEDEIIYLNPKSGIDYLLGKNKVKYEFKITVNCVNGTPTMFLHPDYDISFNGPDNHNFGLELNLFGAQGGAALEGDWTGRLYSKTGEISICLHNGSSKNKVNFNQKFQVFLDVFATESVTVNFGLGLNGEGTKQFSTVKMLSIEFNFLGSCCCGIESIYRDEKRRYR